MAATTPAPATGAQAGQASQVQAAPFRASTFRTLSTDGYNVTQALQTTATQLTPYNPSPNSYLRGLWINAVMTVTNGSSDQVTVAADAPWNVYSTVVFQDANQKPIVGPFDGYTLMVVNKFGGYQNLNDPRASAAYTAPVNGTSGSSGSFTFNLYVPLEIASRDALGDLQNKSSSSQFQLILTTNTLANVYTAATGISSASLLTTIHEDGYVQPKSTDLSGTPLSQSPPQLGTTQYWTRGTYNSLNGNQQIQLTQGLGYPIRNFIGICYSVSSPLRSTGDGYWPATTQIIYKGTSMWNVLTNVWIDQMARLYGLTSTTADAANGRENGVYVLPFTSDFSNAPGDELRNAYLPTQQGDQFQFLGDFTGNSTLYWVANYVAPAAGPNNLASIRAGR